MNIFTEKKAEEFLDKEDFKIINTVYIEKESEFQKVLEKINFPWVMKVSGKTIIHKNRIGGIRLKIKNLDEAIKSFEKLKEIKDCEGVIIQEQIKGKEFLLGIKKTPEFGHVIAFGAGGIHTEELKDVSFRVFPINEEDIEEMIHEVKITKNLDREKISKIKKNLIKLNQLIEKYPKIKELDINPLIVNEKNVIIVDARIVWGD